MTSDLRYLTASRPRTRLSCCPTKERIDYVNKLLDKFQPECNPESNIDSESEIITETETLNYNQPEIEHEASKYVSLPLPFPFVS